MSDLYFSDKRRVRAILLTDQHTLILLKRLPQGPRQTPMWIAPGDAIVPHGADDKIILREALITELGVEVAIMDLALQLFMTRWNFYLCKVVSVNPNRRSPQAIAEHKKGVYKVDELPLDESVIKQKTIQPRALRDYLMANMPLLRVI
ncbi:MAG: hypothetical protein SH821_08625 [Phototrophicales bacterium]|nr:hypothetical protein [Phototrophicales bacterium]